MPGFISETTRNEGERLIIQAHSTATTGRCPRCQQVSSHGHGWYTRRPQDWPCLGQGVYLELSVRRFRCSNPGCPQTTFAEQFPDWLPAYARRTVRLTDVMRQVGFEVSAESSRRVLKWFKITTSGDTVLRIVKGTSVVVPTHPKIVGLDDWAIRKGHRYGSLIIDQETHRVIEVVKGRLAEDIQPWFKAHPEVELVTRDRSTDYRNGLARAAPQAIQSADRFHLLINLRQLAQRVAALAYKRLKQLPVSPQLRPQCPVFARSPGEQKQVEAARQKRLDLYHEVQRLKQEGISAANVALHLNRNYYTIRALYRAETFPEKMPGYTPHSVLLPYVEYLDQRFAAGCSDGKLLFADIQAQGYSGSLAVVQRWLRAKRLLAGEDPVKVRTGLPITNSSAILPSNYKLGWLLVLPPDKLDDDDQLLLDHILQDETIRQFYTLAQDFRLLLKARSVPAFDAWLDTADQSPLSTVRPLPMPCALNISLFAPPWNMNTAMDRPRAR